MAAVTPINGDKIAAELGNFTDGKITFRSVE